MIIKDKTFDTYIDFQFGDIEKFKKYLEKKYNYFLSDNDYRTGITIVIDSDEINVVIWVQKKEPIILSHEILHAIKYWLNDFYEIPLDDSSEEIYTMLHSFYMRNILKNF